MVSGSALKRYWVTVKDDWREPSGWGATAYSEDQAVSLVEAALGRHLPETHKVHDLEVAIAKALIPANEHLPPIEVQDHEAPSLWSPGGDRILAIFFDGTSNEVQAGSDVDGTNVLRLFQALQHDAGPTQYATYIPGVGTIPSETMSTGVGREVRNRLDQALGIGVKADVADGYRFLLSHYRPGDKIFLFGFSRGAYTARALAALLDGFGLVKRGRENLIEYAMEYFWRGNRAKHHTVEYFDVADKFKKSFSWDVPIYFLGLWDTVSSIGLFHALHKLPGTDTLDSVVGALHAVSIDERRRSFSVEPWDPSIEAATYPEFWEDGYSDKLKLIGRGRFRDPEGREVRLAWFTVWFPGVHVDIGGSYPDHQLADTSLRWMALGAAQAGLLVDRARLPEFNADAAPGPAHESWNSRWGPYRRRRIPRNALVHLSALYNLQNDQEYAKRHRMGKNSSWSSWRDTPLKRWVAEHPGGKGPGGGVIPTLWRMPTGDLVADVPDPLRWLQYLVDDPDDPDELDEMAELRRRYGVSRPREL